MDYIVLRKVRIRLSARIGEVNANCDQKVQIAKPSTKGIGKNGEVIDTYLAAGILFTEKNLRQAF